MRSHINYVLEGHYEILEKLKEEYEELKWTPRCALAAICANQIKLLNVLLKDVQLRVRQLEVYGEFDNVISMDEFKKEKRSI